MNMASPYSWAALLALALFVAAAALYIKQAAKLTAYINLNCPDLWQKLRYKGLRLPNPNYRGGLRGGRLERLVLYNIGAADHPADPEFRQLVTGARWCALMCLISFLVFIIFLGEAGPS